MSEVQTVDQNETSITLQWRKVTGVDEYKVQYIREEENISNTVEKEHSTYVINGLSSGTAYHFKIFALFQNIRSREMTHTAATGKMFLSCYRLVADEHCNCILRGFLPFL